MLLGKRFEEIGTVGPEEWGALFGPFDESGEPIPYDELPLVTRGAQRPPRPRRASTIRSTDGAEPRGRGLGLPDPHRARLPGRRSRSSGRAGRARGDRRATERGRREGQALGNARLDPLPRAGDDPLRRQHLLRRRHPRRRLAAGARRRHRHPQPRPRARRRADPAPHPPHPPPPRPHPGPRLLRPRLPAADRDRRSGGRPRPRPRCATASPATSRRRSRRSRCASCPATSPSATARRPSGRSARRRIRAASVAHRGPTLGYRIDDGGSSLAYIPDHEPALGADLDALEDDWISGFALARDASLLIHDGQYADDEYPDHVGWGHSALSHSLAFARRTGAERTVLFHHDPLPLRRVPRRATAPKRAASAGRRSAATRRAIELGAEGAEYELPARIGSPGPGRRPPER